MTPNPSTHLTATTTSPMNPPPTEPRHPGPDQATTRPLPTSTKPPPDPPIGRNVVGLAGAGDRLNPSGPRCLPGPTNPVEQVDPDDQEDRVDCAGSADPSHSIDLTSPGDLADPGQVARVGEEAALLADVSRAGLVGEEAALLADVSRAGLARRARVGASSGGRCVCQGSVEPLLAVGAHPRDPLDVPRRESGARLGAIVGHCRCEPGAVAA